MLKSYFSYLYNNTAKRSGNCMFDMLKESKKALVLDCGCWDGSNTLKFGKKIGTGNLFGIELHKQKAKEASSKGIKVKLSNLNKEFPYPSNHFDVAVAYHVIEHLVNVRQFASEIFRVLKRNGYAIIGTPNLASWHNVFALMLGYQPFSGPTIKPDYESDVGIAKSINEERIEKVFSGSKSSELDHVKVMTLRALRGLLEDSGFKVQESRGFGYYPLPPPFSYFMEKIDPWHSHYLIVKARK